MRPTILAFAVLSLSLAVKGEERERVTVAELLADPARYHEHTVIARGSWDCGFETSLFFDATHPDDVIWLEAAEQDVEHPEDKKLMLLQQLYHMHGCAESVAPQVDLSDIELEIEGVFTNWDSLESTKEAKQEAERERKKIIFGAFGHFGAYQQILRVTRVRWFRCRLESPADTGENNADAHQGVDPTSGNVPRNSGGSPEG